MRVCECVSGCGEGRRLQDDELVDMADQDELSREMKFECMQAGPLFCSHSHNPAIPQCHMRWSLCHSKRSVRQPSVQQRRGAKESGDSATTAAPTLRLLGLSFDTHHPATQTNDASRLCKPHTALLCWPILLSATRPSDSRRFGCPLAMS